MPTFGESPPGLVARFDELAARAAGAERREIFGYPSCVRHGNMFMGLYEDSLILRLAEPDRAEFLSRYGGELFEPLPDRPMKEYVVVPADLVGTAEIGDWVRRSLAYAEQLPPRQGRSADR
jgi:TfoX N-terminal domain